MNIYEKLLKITSELSTVAKNLTVQQTKNSSYKAVSERDILDAVKPLEEKYGVYSYPVSRRILESHVLESENVYKGNTKDAEDIVVKKTTFMTRLETIYRFVNVEKPEEFIETTVFSEGIDSQDKGSGKGMTYADKYALMKAYKISTGDDPDQDASKDERYRNKSINDKKGSVSSHQLKTIEGYPEKTRDWILKSYKIGSLDELSVNQASDVIYKVTEAKKAKEAMANG